MAWLEELTGVGRYSSLPFNKYVHFQSLHLCFSISRSIMPRRNVELCRSHPRTPVPKRNGKCTTRATMTTTTITSSVTASAGWSAMKSIRSLARDPLGRLEMMWTAVLYFFSHTEWQEHADYLSANTSPNKSEFVRPIYNFV